MNWQTVSISFPDTNYQECTERAAVPGGWLYKTTVRAPGDGDDCGYRISVSTTFVEDESFEQREARNKQ